MPNIKRSSPLLKDSIPEMLPPNQAADERVLRRGEMLDKRCRVYKGTLSVNNIPIGTLDYEEYEAWLGKEIEDLPP